MPTGRLWWTRSIAAAAMALASVGAVEAQIRDRTIRFSLGPAEEHPESHGARAFADLVSQKSGGKMKVRNFYNATLGSDTQAVAALRAGTLEMTGPSSSPLVSLVPDFAVFDFAFLLKDEKEADALLDGPFGKMLLEKLTEKDLIGLAYWENGFRNLTNSRRPIAKAEDIKGLKLRVMQNPVYVETFQALGANAVAMSFSEVFAALETKTIDAQENPFATIKSAKLDEVQKYLTVTNHTYTPYVILVGKKFWDGLSAEEQAILRSAAEEARAIQRAYSRDQDVKILAELKAKGMQVTNLADADLAKLREVTKPVTDRFEKNVSPEVIAKLREELAKIRKP